MAALDVIDSDIKCHRDTAGDTALGLHLRIAGRSLLNIGQIADRGVTDIHWASDVHAGVAKVLVLNVLQHRQVVERLLRITGTGILTNGGGVGAISHRSAPREICQQLDRFRHKNSPASRRSERVDIPWHYPHSWASNISSHFDLFGDK